MLKRWQVLGKSAAAKTAIAVTIVLSLVALPLPASMGWAQGKAEAAPPTQEPPGQKTRRGLAGSVISFATTTVSTMDPVADGEEPVTTDGAPTTEEGDPIITIGSKFGDVQVVITEDTIIHSPLQYDLNLADLEGQRVAIHFAKGPPNEDGSRTALRIMVIPSKAVRTHSRGVIKAKKGGDDGELELVGDDDEVIALGDVDGVDLDEGDAVVVITQTVTDFEGDGDSSGRGRPKKIARGLQKSSKIVERLDRIMDRLTRLGDSPKAEKLRARVEKFKSKQLQRFNDLNIRFSGDGSDSDSEDGKQNRGRNNRGRPVDVGSTDFGPSDDGDDGGKQNRGRNRGRSVDLFPQGDGDEDSDRDKENRGMGKGRNSGKRGGNN